MFRHEQTLSKPKSDRLNLLRATRAHFGQIFMLYSDPALTAEKILFSGTSAPEIEVTDEFGVTHRVWKVSDMSTINILLGAMEDKKLIIADGHHRYETALAYSAGARPTQRHPDGEEPGQHHAAARLPGSCRHDDLRQHGLDGHYHSAHPSRGFRAQGFFAG